MLKKFFKVLGRILGVSPTPRRSRKHHTVSPKKAFAVHPQKKASTPKPRRPKVQAKERPKRRSAKRIIPPVKKSAPAAKKGKATATKKFLEYIGDVTHYFSKIMVCVVKVQGVSIRLGDEVQIQGKTSLKFKVASLQIESKDVSSASKGHLVGLKVPQPISVGDKIYRIRS